MDRLEKELLSFLEERGLRIGYEIAFPRYKQLPNEVLLALSVIKSHGVKFVVKLEPDTNDSK